MKFLATLRIRKGLDFRIFGPNISHMATAVLPCHKLPCTIFWLVVSTPLKNMKINGKDDIPYIVENNPAMFETIIMGSKSPPSLSTPLLN